MYVNLPAFLVKTQSDSLLIIDKRIDFISYIVCNLYVTAKYWNSIEIQLINYQKTGYRAESRQSRNAPCVLNEKRLKRAEKLVRQRNLGAFPLVVFLYVATRLFPGWVRSQCL